MRLCRSAGSADTYHIAKVVLALAVDRRDLHMTGDNVGPLGSSVPMQLARGDVSYSPDNDTDPQLTGRHQLPGAC